MSLIKRLQRLTGESSRETEKFDRSGEIADLRKRIDMIMARRPAARPPSAKPPAPCPLTLEEVIPGEDFINAAGTCFIRENELDSLTLHGHRRLGDFAGLSMQAASLLANDTSLGDYLLEEGLFLDTETTGLAGGTGTMAFLIGLGWFDGGRFTIRQIFVRDFAQERAALNHLSEIVGNRRFLVSFNGKAFDVGLLSTRYVMNRLQDPFIAMPHLDLLHPSRRLIAHRLGNCRLATIEAQVLGLVRHSDIPGSDIPQRYFDWLRRGDARLLKDVFEHNRLDVVSLVALMGYLSGLVEGRRDGIPADERDLLAVARLHIDRQDIPQALYLLSSLLQSSGALLRTDVRKMLSLLHKRAGHWEDALGIWHQMLQDHPGDLFALIELAKWYEHRAHDHTTALNLVGLALEQVDGHSGAADRESLLHRRQRLLRRQFKQDDGNI